MNELNFCKSTNMDAVKPAYSGRIVKSQRFQKILRPLVYEVVIEASDTSVEISTLGFSRMEKS
jgi:hypothetical protein